MGQLEMAIERVSEVCKHREVKDKTERVLKQAVEACSEVAMQRDAALERAVLLESELEVLRGDVVRLEERRDADLEEARAVKEAMKVAESQARSSAKMAENARLEKDDAVTARDAESQEKAAMRGLSDAKAAEAAAAVADR